MSSILTFVIAIGLIREFDLPWWAWIFVIVAVYYDEHRREQLLEKLDDLETRLKILQGEDD